jgi:hypothetical protein
MTYLDLYPDSWYVIAPAGQAHQPHGPTVEPAISDTPKIHRKTLGTFTNPQGISTEFPNSADCTIAGKSDVI